MNELFNNWTSLSYRCIVVPTPQINQAAPSSKRSLRRSKLVFTHLDTYRRSFPGKPQFDVTLDEDDFDPDVQRITLNYTFWNKYGGDYDMFERIRGMSSLARSKKKGLLRRSWLRSINGINEINEINEAEVAPPETGCLALDVVGLPIRASVSG